MNENKQIQITSTGLFLFGLFLIAYSYNKLYLGQAKIDFSQNKIGLIENYQNEVRVKKTNHFEWLTLKKPENIISSNDRIFTNQNASATIKLDSGNQINIAEQTLLRISDDNAINVEKGNLEFTLKENAKPIEIILNKKKYKITAKKSSVINISQKKNQTTSIAVTKGDIEVKSVSTQESIDVSGQEELTISQTASAQKVLLKDPVNKTFETINKTKSIEFEYEPKNDNDKILVAKNINFNNAKLVQAKSVKIPKGLYFWKVNDSRPETFKIINILPTPIITEPEDDQSFILFDKSLNIKVNIQTISSQGLTLELLDQNKHLIKEFSITKNSTVLEDLRAGQYYIKVRHFKDYEKSNWSELIKFTISPYEYNDKDAIVIELAKPDQRVKFEWEQNKNGTSLFEVSEDPSFNNIRVRKRLRKQNFTHVNFSKIGKYYWRARNIEANGNKTIQKPVQVIIKPAPPLDKPKDLPNLKFKIKPKGKTSFIQKILNLFISPAYAAPEFEEILVNLPSDDNVKSYNVEIYRDLDLKQKVAEIKTTKPYFRWSPPEPGDYYWRLQYIDFWDQPSEFSDISKITIIADLPPPVEKVSPKKIKQVKTVKKEPIKTEPKKVTRTKKKIKKRKIIRNVYFHIGPSSVNFLQEDTNNFKIEGSTYNSYHLGFESTLNNNAFSKMRIELNSNFGEVFEGQTFFFRRLEFALRQNWLRYFWINLDVKQIAQYESNLGTPEFDQAKYLPNLGLSYEKAIFRGRKSKLSLRAGLKPVLGFDAQLNLTYQYYYKKRFSIIVDGEGYSSTQSYGDIDQKVEYFSVLTGLKYYF